VGQGFMKKDEKKGNVRESPPYPDLYVHFSVKNWKRKKGGGNRTIPTFEEKGKKAATLANAP